MDRRDVNNGTLSREARWSLVFIGLVALGWLIWRMAGAQVELLLGILGMLVATPIAVVVMVLVTMLYVQDVLGKENIPVPGH